jgi:hypothetical protein
LRIHQEAALLLVVAVSTMFKVSIHLDVLVYRRTMFVFEEIEVIVRQLQDDVRVPRRAEIPEARGAREIDASDVSESAPKIDAQQEKADIIRYVLFIPRYNLLLERSSTNPVHPFVNSYFVCHIASSMSYPIRYQ